MVYGEAVYGASPIESTALILGSRSWSRPEDASTTVVLSSPPTLPSAMYDIRPGRDTRSPSLAGSAGLGLDPRPRCPGGEPREAATMSEAAEPWLGLLCPQSSEEEEPFLSRPSLRDAAEPSALRSRDQSRAPSRLESRDIDEGRFAKAPAPKTPASEAEEGRLALPPIQPPPSHERRGERERRESSLTPSGLAGPPPAAGPVAPPPRLEPSASPELTEPADEAALLRGIIDVAAE